MKKNNKDFSKKIIEDLRPLLWIITIAGLILAFYCVYKDYIGSLGWVATMVSSAWISYNTVQAVYLNMAKSDHSVGGITFETAKANNFTIQETNNYGDEI